MSCPLNVRFEWITVNVLEYTATLMRVPNVWNIAAILSVTTMLFAFFFALAYLNPTTFNFNPEVFAMIGFFTLFLYLIAPVPALERMKTKRFLRRSILKQITSPFSTVEFIDFFLADQWFVYVLTLYMLSVLFGAVGALLSQHFRSDW